MREETERFFAAIVQRGSQRARFSRCRLHVRQRAAGPALRNRGRARGTSSAACRSSRPARGGVLTQASVLTLTSNPTRTSPVKRGNWVLENLLGTPPPPPPPDVPELNDSAAGSLARLAARADGAASRKGRVRGLPQSHGSARLWAGELRRHRRLADARRHIRHRSVGHAAGRQVVFRPADLKTDSEGPAKSVRPLPGGKVAHLCPGPRAGSIMIECAVGRDRRRQRERRLSVFEPGDGGGPERSVSEASNARGHNP